MLCRKVPKLSEQTQMFEVSQAGQILQMLREVASMLPVFSMGALVLNERKGENTIPRFLTEAAFKAMHSAIDNNARVEGESSQILLAHDVFHRGRGRVVWTRHGIMFGHK